MKRAQIRFRPAPLFALAAVLVPQTASAAPVARAVIYRCRDYSTLDAGSGALTLTKEFREDGSAAGMTVRWEDRSGSFLRSHARGDRLSAELNWPGDDPTRNSGPFDWSRGSVRVHAYPAGDASKYRPRKKEMWRQVLIDRDGSLRVYESKGERILLPMGFMLASALDPLSSPGDLWMSIDPLLAWGSGTESLRVYETLVTRRRIEKNSYPNSADGARRIVAEYEIDTAALGRKIGEIRRAAEAWEAALSDFKSRCERGLEDSNTDIIVT